MFGWFKKKRVPKLAAGSVTKKQMRAGSTVGPNPMADRIKELEAEGYTYQGALKAEGPMKGATIMVKDPTKDKQQ